MEEKTLVTWHDHTVARPRGCVVWFTGLSGSGKSTVAFDILFAEGQRRYLESLNAYARQFVQPASRPDVDAIFGIPPTVAIEQRTSRGGRKSTVATMTEIYHFLRLLFVKLGTQYCPECQLPIEPQTREAILARIMRDYRNRRVGLYAPLVVARKGYYTELAKWAAAKGFPELRVDGSATPTESWMASKPSSTLEPQRATRMILGEDRAVGDEHRLASVVLAEVSLQSLRDHDRGTRKAHGRNLAPLE